MPRCGMRICLFLALLPVLCAIHCFTGRDDVVTTTGVDHARTAKKNSTWRKYPPTPKSNYIWGLLHRSIEDCIEYGVQSTPTENRVFQSLLHQFFGGAHDTLSFAPPRNTLWVFAILSLLS